MAATSEASGGAARRAFGDWLAHVRAQLDAAGRADPWRGQPPHQALFMLLIERRFLIAMAALLLALFACAAIAGLHWLEVGWLPEWLRAWHPLPVALLAALQAAIVARAEIADCREQRTRVQEAELAVAALVMANSGLFDPRNQEDLPGVVVATLDPVLMADPEQLKALAHRLHSLKAKPDQAPAALQPIARVLADELGRFTPLLVPRELAGNDATWLSSCWFFREQLPNGVLDRRIYPVLAQRRTDPSPCRSLPRSQWWSAEFDASLAAEFGGTTGARA